MKEQPPTPSCAQRNWAVSARYAAPGSRPGNRRHPVPEDFCRRTVVGAAAPSTVEALFDLLEVPENIRVKIRAKDVVRDFVEGKLVPDQVYPHHTIGMHYVSNEPDAQLVEWSIEFAFVSQIHKPVKIHILSQERQPYGSERRCCNHCGIMIWGSSAPLHVDNWAAWRAHPDRCGKEDSR
jgi:hypothetical protein